MQNVSAAILLILAIVFFAFPIFAPATSLPRQGMSVVR